MSNIHGLYTKKEQDSSDDDDDDGTNNRYVGGIDARGGGRYVELSFFQFEATLST